MTSKRSSALVQCCQAHGRQTNWPICVCDDRLPATCSTCLATTSADIDEETKGISTATATLYPFEARSSACRERLDLVACRLRCGSAHGLGKSFAGQWTYYNLDLDPYLNMRGPLNIVFLLCGCCTATVTTNRFHNQALERNDSGWVLANRVDQCHSISMDTASAPGTSDTVPPSMPPFTSTN